MPEIELSQGRIHYQDTGSGPPIVLVHGLLVNSRIWERLVPLLSDSVRCIVPNLPLGSHPEPMKAGADLSPPALASLLSELVERLDLGPVTLVGNDTGGALCQIACADHPERIGRLVLTDCDSFEHFPPRAFKAIVKGGAYIPGGVASLGLLGRSAGVRRRAMSLASLTVDPVPDELLESWVSPLRERGIRRDLVKVLRGISTRYTFQAAEKLRGFSGPVLLAWGTDDKFFPWEHAERLAGVFQNAQLERVEGARTFVQLDAPERLAALIKGG